MPGEPMAARPARQSSFDTVVAAAAIVSARSRLGAADGEDTRRGHRPRLLRRLWSAVRVYWCITPNPDSSRISHADINPDRADDPPPPAITNTIIPIIAPPSSPASSLMASVAQSPSASLNSFSPVAGGIHSIFAVGPYAHETQLVSPPAFSSFTTEPSTAPFTPPPEPSVLLTHPSSPEVPFASGGFSPAGKKPDVVDMFYSYQLFPGSPIGQLVSPSSVCSGSSSPPSSLLLRVPPKILTPEEIAARKLIPRHSRKDGSILDGRISAAPSPGLSGRRLSFDLQEARASTESVPEARAVVPVPRRAPCPEQLTSLPSEWWANEIATTEPEPPKNWQFLAEIEQAPMN